VTIATVLIPTHEHVLSLRHAVASVQQQTLQDFELFIVGDGVSNAGRALVAELAAADSRIRFFDFPKGPRKGEVYARGVLTHTDDEHVDLDLGTIRWHLVVHNIQGASYTLSGGGTAAQFD